MKKKICKFTLVATLFLVGLYSFGTTALAEEEDFNNQEVTFSLVQGKESPKEKDESGISNGSMSGKPLGRGTLPSTGELTPYFYSIVGLISLIASVSYIIAKRSKEGKSYET